MFDDFYEQISERRHKGIYTLLYALTWVMIIIFGLFGVMMLSQVFMMSDTEFAFNWMNLIIGIVFAALALLMWRRSDYCRLEYEYSFTNGTMDVAMVMNNRRRRYLASFQMNDVIRCGPVQSPAFRKVLGESGIKKHNWFLNRTANLYFFYFTKNNVKHVAVLELNKHMIELINGKKKYLQPGVWVNEDGKSDYHYGVS